MTCHHRVGVLAVVVASVCSLATVERAQSDSTAAVLADIEQRLTRLILAGDQAAYSAYLTDDWSVINTDGQILTKEQVLRDMFVTGARRIEAIAVDDVRVRPLGDVAIVTGRTVASGTVRGEKVTATLRFTDVFVRRGGRWQIAASQGTRVP
jgi:ketosteroid isomerase-like protein